jgi:L-2-hydroxyglutarate oxidase
VPEITESDLVPAGSGIRAQACSRNGTLLDDFKILRSRRVVHVCNAPSPAATASLAIGARVAEWIEVK